jgi:hypothetical protein
MVVTEKIFAGCLCTVLWIALAVPSHAAETGPSSPATPADPRPVSGKVTEVLKAGQYTYLHLDDGKEKVWVATYATFKVGVGDEVRLGDYMVMEQFKSKTLNRTFDSVLFTGEIQIAGQTKSSLLELPPGHPNIQTASGQKSPDALPAGHPAIGPGKTPIPTVKKNSVKKIRGGYTVQECFARKKSLEGKTIKVRGVVVKSTPSIMSRNWIHIQDGTGGAGANDLTVTTKEAAHAGEVIVVTGKLNYDRDFGAGYSYAAIIEDATISREGTYQPSP